MRGVKAIKRCFKKYAVFSGRAGREEYWAFAIFAMAGFWLIAGGCALWAAGGGVAMEERGWTFFYGLELCWGALVGAPHAAVGSRRLRDSGKSGWLMLGHAVPSGHWALVWLCCLPGDPGENRFGPPEPLGGEGEVKAELARPRAGDGGQNGGGL